MGKPLTRFFLDIVGLLLIIMSVTILVRAYGGTSALLSAADKQQINMDAENAQGDLMQYSGATVKGSDVAALVKMAGFYNVGIVVDNGLSTKKYYYTDDDTTEMRTRQTDYDSVISSGWLTKKTTGKEEYYISPIDTYKCEVVMSDDTGVVTRVICRKA